MHASIVQQLLKFEPFKRFVLITAAGHEYEVNSPKHYRILDESDVLFWTEDGTGDFIDLKLVERIRVDDDFGFVELDRLR